MESLYDTLTRWQPFFTAVAGASATLAGLLFVALSINREKITAHENHILLLLARRSFGDLLYVLFIALMFLIPNHEPRGLAIPLFSIAAFRGWWFLCSYYRAAKRTAKSPAVLGTFTEEILQTIAFLALVFATLEIYWRNYVWIFLLVPVIALLLRNASRNAWLLLIMEKSLDKIALNPQKGEDPKKTP